MVNYELRYFYVKWVEKLIIVDCQKVNAKACAVIGIQIALHVAILRQLRKKKPRISRWYLLLRTASF